MRTHGSMREKSLSLIISKITLGLFIVLTVWRITEVTGEGNTFGAFERRKVLPEEAKSESDWKKYYGSCPELKEDIKKYGKDKFKRFIISLHDSVGKTNYEETKQLFINNVLIESLDDNTPRFYNSNILGRYYRKDYFDYPLDKT
jgi:hypothetical protein